MAKNQKVPGRWPRDFNWVQGLDLNQRPSGYEPDELPGCSTLQQKLMRNTETLVELVAAIERPPGSREPRPRRCGIMSLPAVRLLHPATKGRGISAHPH